MQNLHPSSVASRRTWPALLYAFAAYTGLAILTTFPLVLHLSSRLPKDLGDPLLTASILWWNAHVTPLTERWWNGFGFFPAPGMMAFSEHFLGASLIASPLQWIGFSPITAYNLTFLASFPLCAAAAHALAFVLTKRHDAAIVCGLAYGFNPYRVAHVEHLELLLAFGMPAALTALHLYAETRRARWLVVFVVSLIVQAVSASYYALFFTVLLGLWVLWFMRARAWRETLAIVAAAGASALVVSPIVLGYSHIHRTYDVTRDFTEEILRFSADLSSFITASPLSAVWGWTAALNGGERQLFPGFMITALGIAGAVVLGRFRTEARDRLATASKIAWVIAAIFATIAIAASVGGPWRVNVAWLRISVTVPYKPLSLAAAFAIIAVALSPTLRSAFRQRSALAFYLVAAVILFLCSLGPEPTAWGARILYEPPYAWLMRLPFFGDTVRVPARFAMLGILALSVAGSLAFHHLSSLKGRRNALFVAVIAGIVADGWISGLPLPAAPQNAFRIPSADRPAAVLELPLGDVWGDAAALYRVTLHGTPTVNGYNGYEPSYYQVLRRALANGNHTVLDALASFGPLLIAADADVDTSFLLSHPNVRRLSDDGTWASFWLPHKARRPAPDRCANNPLAVTAVFDAAGEVDAAMLTDQSPATRWITSHPQRAGDVLILDLGRVQPVCGVIASMGAAAVLYPGTLSVATSFDNLTWETRFVGKMAGLAFRAALENPRDARISLPVGSAARFIRLRIEESHPVYPWAVADIVVQRQR